jgi:hypothetical protein
MILAEYQKLMMAMVLRVHTKLQDRRPKCDGS